MMPKVTLRAPVPDDVDVLTAWENIDADQPVTHGEMLQFINENQRLHTHKQQRFVILDDDKPSGTVDLTNLTADGTAAYVSIFIDAQMRSKGLATKALALVINEAISLSIYRLGAIINDDNIISQALFTAAGFVPVTECRDIDNATVWMLDIATRHVENNT